MATSPRFEETGGGAAVGNPKLARQVNGDADAQEGGFYGGAPPKASAAPKGTTANLFTGLCEALNSWQADLVKNGPYKKADVYAIKFVPPAMADSQLKKPGATDQSNTPMQQGTTAKLQLDPQTNVLNVTGRTVQATAGTQIIQFIDQIMKGSTYISSQQLWQNDEVTQKAVKNPTGGNGPVAWYKISAQVESLGFDPGRNDDAYKITYIISPYGINETSSQYFPQTAFRGVHKSYYYWFTGENTEILNYELKLNNLYYNVVSGNLPQLQQGYVTDKPTLYKRSWQTRSNQSDQYASGNANEPAANLADFLYSWDNFAEIDLQILGDPAWIPQGELAGGLTPNNFSFAAFNSDDGINFDASEATFSVKFNQPEDYNLETGLMEVAGNYKKQNGTFGQNHPAQERVYKIATVKHTFSKGKFEQHLHGTLYQDVSATNTTTPRPSASDARTKPATKSVEVRNTEEIIASAQNFDPLANYTGEYAISPPNSSVLPTVNIDKTTLPLITRAPTSNGRVSPTLNPTEQTLAPQPNAPQYGNRET